jgi:hypothetical protein
MFKFIKAVLKSVFYVVIGSVAIYLAFKTYHGINDVPEQWMDKILFNITQWPLLVITAVIGVACTFFELLTLVSGLKVLSQKGFFNVLFGILIILVSLAVLGVFGYAYYCAIKGDDFFKIALDFIQPLIDKIRS